MANAADKVKDPQVIMPRAFLVAIGVTTLLYISLALVLLSDVSALELEKYADTAVAQAASPLLGHVGYVIVVIALYWRRLQPLTRTCSPCLTSWTTWAANANCRS